MNEAENSRKPKPKPMDRRKLSYIAGRGILRPDLTTISLDHAWGVYHCADRASGLPQGEERGGADMNAHSAKKDIAAIGMGDVSMSDGLSSLSANRGDPLPKHSEDGRRGDRTSGPGISGKTSLGKTPECEAGRQRDSVV